MNKITLTEDDEIIRMTMQLLEQDAYVDISEDIKYPPVAISCGTYQDRNLDGTFTEYPIPIGTYGNFSFIQAPPKSMKTYFLSLLSASYQKKNDYSGLIKGNRQGKKIIHFDTEQGKFHCQKVFRRPLIMNNLTEDKGYYTYALRSLNYKDRINFIDYILKDKLDGDNIGLVIIDGVADLVADVNNLEKCNELVQKLMEWTDKLNCHITTIIHSNYGSEKPTGHLGSFLEKKAETQIKLEKNTVNKGWITVECKRSRNRAFEPFSFTLDDKGFPIFVENDYNFLD